MANGLKEREAPQTWHWSECQDRRELIATWPREAPSQPTVGEGWYDEDSEALCVWDGAEWVCNPSD